MSVYVFFFFWGGGGRGLGSWAVTLQRILHQGLVVIMAYLRTYFITLLELPMTNLQRR